MSFKRKACRVHMMLLLIALVIALNTIIAIAVTLDNDGSARDVPYGDSKLANCYEGASYVDCYIPYNLTCEEIGGYALSASAADHVVTTGGGSAMPESIRKSPVATTVMREAPYSYAVSQDWDLVGYSNPTGLPVEVESDTGMNYITDLNGSKYYMTAVQPFFFNHPKAGTDGFPANESGGFGQIMDVILTDGTCIHFVCFDINAGQHTNGVDDSGEGKFDYVYNNAELKYKQYNNLFSCQNGNTLEIWGTSNEACTNFKNKYNMGKGEGQNRIAYYRMYNKYVKESPKRASGVGTEVSFSYGSVTIASSDSESSKEGTGSSLFSITKEEDLVGMPEGSRLLEAIKDLSDLIPNGDGLSIMDKVKIQNMRDNLSISKVEKVLDTCRISVVFIGLCMIMYCIVLIVAFIFDKVNIFFEFSLVSLITFGRMHFSENEIDSRVAGVMTVSRLIKVVAVVLVVGLFFVSGGVFLWLSRFVLWVLRLIG